MKKKVGSILLLLLVCMTVIAPLTAFAGTGDVTCSDAFGASSGSADSTIKTTLQSIIKIIGGVGGLLFTLAVMVIAVMIIFGSISTQKRGTYWTALIGCFAGAFVFFSGYKFAGAIAELAQNGSGC
ncbi:TrbC/VirB2 family protein [Paenibacillus polymyxa]|uniref:TrbC/VirB2 family protein n=1 Tax=Paenibacillus polymyxa TaxID=1406 RepID=UPI000311775E|nr:TrbC/VirB2 family protein [Paenibacillus polymyxa]MDN4106181.1 TrbC/VirB2 family protein [Paenibacillus polymyxa]